MMIDKIKVGDLIVIRYSGFMTPELFEIKLYIVLSIKNNSVKYRRSVLCVDAFSVRNSALYHDFWLGESSIVAVISDD